jgi:fumarate hydratase class II
VTGLVPIIGYDKAAAIAKKAYDSGKTIRDVVRDESILPEDALDDLLKG